MTMTMGSFIDVGVKLYNDGDAIMIGGSTMVVTVFV